MYFFYTFPIFTPVFIYLLPFSSRFQTKNSGDGRVTLVSLLNILKNFNCRHSLCTCVVEPVLQRVACFSPCRMSKRLSPTPLRNFLLVYLRATAHDLLARAIPVSGLSVRFLENEKEVKKNRRNQRLCKLIQFVNHSFIRVEYTFSKIIRIIFHISRNKIISILTYNPI